MAMAASSSAKSLEDGLSCSLCHKYFTEPVSIDCGHSFCRACIAQHWEEWETNMFCPQCGERSLKRKLRPNKDLENIVQIAKRIKLETTDGVGGEGMCEMHQEPLKFFCKDEQKLVCSACTPSTDHSTHAIVAADEAAQNFKEELETLLQAWKDKREQTFSFRTKEEEKYKEFHKKVDAEKQKIMSKFEEAQNFLKQQEETMLDQLDELRKTEEDCVTRLSSEISLMDIFICEMEEKIHQPVNAFLQNIGEAFSRYKMWTSQQPDICSELEKKLHAFSKKYIILQETLRAFRENLPQQLAVEWVSVTLDPNTAHPSLIVSADQKNVALRQENCVLTHYLQQFSHSTCVLGCEGFTSGRHYWEVKVLNTSFWDMWALGVARESVGRKKEVKLQPDEGVWVVRKDMGSPAFCNSKEKGLPSSCGFELDGLIPKTIGIYLDYGGNRVSFFNADQGNILHTFHSTSFNNENIRPFFYVKFVNRYARLTCS